MTLNKIIILLGNGALLRKKVAVGEGPVELLYIDRSIEQVDWQDYHNFRKQGYGTIVAYPSKYSSNDGLFANIPGHDEYYYFGLNDKGKEYSHHLLKGKNNV